MSWRAIAERAARARGAETLAKVERAIAEHSPGAAVETGADEIRVRGRGLKQRWIADPMLRFARRTGR